MTSINTLSRREREILTLTGTGLSSADIADRLFISTRGVESHRQHIKQKLGLASYGALWCTAARYVVANGLDDGGLMPVEALRSSGVGMET